MIDITIERIRSTPVKKVMYQDRLIGAFYHGEYYQVAGFNEKIREVIDDGDNSEDRAVVTG